MRRTRIYLLMTAVAVALTAIYATLPTEARAADRKHLYEILPDGLEKCSGTCTGDQRCCTITPAPAP